MTSSPLALFHRRRVLALDRFWLSLGGINRFATQHIPDLREIAIGFMPCSCRNFFAAAGEFDLGRISLSIEFDRELPLAGFMNYRRLGTMQFALETAIDLDPASRFI